MRTPGQRDRIVADPAGVQRHGSQQDKATEIIHPMATARTNGHGRSGGGDWISIQPGTFSTDNPINSRAVMALPGVGRGAGRRGHAMPSGSSNATPESAAAVRGARARGRDRRHDHDQHQRAQRWTSMGLRPPVACAAPRRRETVLARGRGAARTAVADRRSHPRTPHHPATESQSSQTLLRQVADRDEPRDEGGQHGSHSTR